MIKISARRALSQSVSKSQCLPLQRGVVFSAQGEGACEREVRECEQHSTFAQYDSHRRVATPTQTESYEQGTGDSFGDVI